MTLLTPKSPIEKVVINGMTVSLLGAGDGTEIIHHHLLKGQHWALTPADGWQALEYLYILTGSLLTESTQELWAKGQSIYASPIDEHTVFVAQEDTTFLYVSSQPVFHYYSEFLRKLMDLAVSVEEKDGYTADHCKRITRLSMLVGKALQLDSHSLYKLNLSSFLHDIGKTCIPLEVLQKPSKLTDEEWVIMKAHTTYGREALEQTNNPTLKEVGIIVEQHHERFDGKGYPHGLSGHDIAIQARIIAVVDSFDAMTTDRVYQKARSVEEALTEIQRCSGEMYDPDVVEIFISLESDIISMEGGISK